MDLDWPLLLCCGFLLLPIPLGYLWVIVYRYRYVIGIPDWLSGILAQGIISWHKIQSGSAGDGDYGFIIVATVILVLIIICSCALIIPVKVKVISVDSTISWQSTGMVLRKGSPIYIGYLSGEWTVDSQRFQFVGPEGYTRDVDGRIWGAPQCKIVWSAPYGQLLGGIDGGPVFIVGRGGFFRAPNDGELLLSINDRAPCLTDNLGELTILIIAIVKWQPY